MNFFEKISHQKFWCFIHKFFLTHNAQAVEKRRDKWWCIWFGLGPYSLLQIPAYTRTHACSGRCDMMAFPQCNTHTHTCAHTPSMSIMWSAAYCKYTHIHTERNSQCSIHKCELVYCMGKKIHTHFTAFVFFLSSSSILFLIKAMVFACIVGRRKTNTHTTKYYNALSIIHLQASNQICTHLRNRQKTFIVLRLFVCKLRYLSFF